MKNAPNGGVRWNTHCSGCVRFRKELDGKPIVEIMDARAHFGDLGVGWSLDKWDFQGPPRMGPLVHIIPIPLP